MAVSHVFLFWEVPDADGSVVSGAGDDGKPCRCFAGSAAWFFALLSGVCGMWESGCRASLSERLWIGKVRLGNEENTCLHWKKLVPVPACGRVYGQCDCAGYELSGDYKEHCG